MRNGGNEIISWRWDEVDHSDFIELSIGSFATAIPHIFGRPAESFLSIHKLEKTHHSNWPRYLLPQPTDRRQTRPQGALPANIMGAGSSKAARTATRKYPTTASKAAVTRPAVSRPQPAPSAAAGPKDDGE